MGVCLLLAAAGVRCDDYDEVNVIPRYPVRPRFSAPEATAPKAAQPPLAGPPAPATADPDVGADPLPGAPDYLPPTYRASLECPRPRAAITTTPRPAVPLLVPQLEEDADPAGTLGTYQPDGPTNTAASAFFQPLGVNGRACITCHEPAQGMSISVDGIQLRFKQSHGRDPLFAPVDGANCPNAVREAQTTEAPVGGRRGEGAAKARASHSLLLTRGLIRIFLPVPSDAEYAISVASDPYRCNTDPNYNRANDPRTGAVHQMVSVYRRPRPATNLKFVTTTSTTTDPITGEEVSGGGNIMWDGREPSLESQAVDATLIHAQALASPTDAQLSQIVSFQRGIFSAQIFSNEAHSLTDLGALGGPDFLATVAVRPDGGAPPGPFTLFDAWRSLPEEADRRAERESIVRGQQIFETRPFVIANVAGVNDALRLGGPIPNGVCASCHNQTAAGTSAFAASQLDIGIGGDSVEFGGPSPLTDLPVFKVQCTPGAKTAFHGSTILTNDPGKALITGKCADVGRFTVAPLRGLAARAPYFSDGSAATLGDVVDFYDKRFAIGLSPQEKADLARFLSAL